MAKKKTAAQWLNHLTFRSLFDHYKNVSINTFEWSGLPEGIQERYLERILFEEGKILFFRDPSMSYMALPCSNGNRLDVYGEPLHWRATGLNYCKEYHRDDCVLIENNKLRTPTENMVKVFVHKMYQASRTMDVNLSTSKMPWAIVCDDRQLLTYKTIMQKIDENEPAIFGVQGLANLDGVQVLQTKAQFIGNDLMDFHRSVESQLLTYLGIDNCPVDKKERLITDEAQSNNQQISVNVNVMLEARQRACEAINALFPDLNVSVKLRNEMEVGEDVSQDVPAGDDQPHAGTA